MNPAQEAPEEQPRNTAPEATNPSTWFQPTQLDQQFTTRRKKGRNKRVLFLATTAALILIIIASITAFSSQDNANNSDASDLPSFGISGDGIDFGTMPQNPMNANQEQGSSTESGPDEEAAASPPDTPPAADNPVPSPITPETPGGGTGSTAKTFTVAYQNSCYSPDNIVLTRGDTINFVNNSTNKKMWPASDNHPSHQIYPEFDPGRDFAPGESWSFTFNKVGSWNYHDHNKPGCTGVITVR